MSIADVLKQNAPDSEKEIAALHYSSFLFVTFVLMAVALIYVWSHIHMTELEYQIAAETSRKEQLLEEQRKLKVEYATLKSPQRIEAIARENLQMIYPERDQVILVK
ncbi:MAG: cell division protein FtsL [Deltaproteobacteria bacterium]|nr:cell division protein FtsL [Deltaproteobacteria bacterium]